MVMKNISRMNNATLSPSWTCEASNVVGVALLIPIPIIATLVNLSIALAVTIYGKNLLRQNAVYLCVISTLLSNLGVLALHLWEHISSIMAIMNNDVTNFDHTDLTVWVLCQAGAASMLFVMCWNLCALIYIMLDTTYFHSAARIAKNGSEQPAVKLLASKRWKTALLIMLSWLVPVAFTVAGVITWNCADVCECSFGAAGVACPENGCSIVWPPLKISFVAVQEGLWLLEIFCLIGFVSNGINEFVIFLSLSGKGLTNQLAAPEPGEKEITHPVSQENETDFHQSTTKRRRIPSWNSWNPRLKLATILSALFILTTAIPALVFLLDVLGVPHNIEVSRALSSTFIYIYTLLSPILMITYMPNLRKALFRLLTAILLCFK